MGNLDDQRHWSSDNEGEDQEVVTEVGAVDDRAGKQVSGNSYSGIINNVRRGGEVGTSSAKEPDPPYPPDTPSESDCYDEDAGYGSGADSTVLKSKRAVTWFPPLPGGSSQKRNNLSRFGPGFQGEPSIVTNFTKRRKIQVIESEILDSASMPLVCFIDTTLQPGSCVAHPGSRRRWGPASGGKGQEAGGRAAA